MLEPGVTKAFEISRGIDEEERLVNFSYCDPESRPLAAPLLPQYLHSKGLDFVIVVETEGWHKATYGPSPALTIEIMELVC